jgi:DNA-directed RNA polymerase subunit RPC12/RpoP
MGEKKRKKLDYRCGKCHNRYSLAELLELGYAEKVGNVIQINCPHCDNLDFIDKK